MKWRSSRLGSTQDYFSGIASHSGSTFVTASISTPPCIWGSSSMTAYQQSDTRRRPQMAQGQRKRAIIDNLKELFQKWLKKRAAKKN